MLQLPIVPFKGLKINVHTHPKTSLKILHERGSKIINLGKRCTNKTKISGGAQLGFRSEDLQQQQEQQHFIYTRQRKK